MGCTLDCLEGLTDDMLSRLRQYLNGHILRDHVALDQSTDKIVLGVRGSRETYLDLLESDLYQ